MEKTKKLKMDLHSKVDSVFRTKIKRMCVFRLEVYIHLERIPSKQEETGFEGGFRKTHTHSYTFPRLC